MTSKLVRLIAVLGVWALAGCQRSHGEFGSESHFLRGCSGDAQCGPLTCHVGVCTSQCSSDRQCTEAFGGDAACRGGVCGITAEQPPREQAANLPREGVSGPCEPMGPVAAARGPAALRCEFETPFEADDACLLAPQPAAGIQLHFGPSSYESGELAEWAIQPGEELSESWSFQLPNTSELVNAQWEFSARPWLRRAVLEVFEPPAADSGGDDCPAPRLVATLPVLTATRIERDAFAPENADVVRRLPARAYVQVSIHGYNVTDRPGVREFWLNLYPATTTAPEVEGVLHLQGGDASAARFECPIEHAGRLLSARARTPYQMGRLTATLRRADGTRVPVLNELDMNGPTYLFDSITQNPPPSDAQSSAHSGTLSFERGDVFEWGCVVNGTDRTPTQAGDASHGAPCDVIGATVGGDIRCAR